MLSLGNRQRPLRTTRMFSISFSYVYLASRPARYRFCPAEARPVEHFDQANHAFDHVEHEHAARDVENKVFMLRTPFPFGSRSV